MTFEESHLEQIMPQASRARLKAFADPLRQAMARFAIDAGLRRAAAFIAQLAHESGQFRFMEELWGPTAAQTRYEPPGKLAAQLGNTEKGDGLRFKGRGPIQVTGRANYKRYGELLEIDLIGQPQLAGTPEVGFALAGLYWDRNQLNTLADRGDFEGVTRRINGGVNGLADRRQFYEKALVVLAPVFPVAEALALAAAAPPGARGGVTPTEVLFPRGAEALRAAAAATPRKRRAKRPAASARAASSSDAKAG